jgi:parvulin-like peptidyl-prolyl isomerase
MSNPLTEVVGANWRDPSQVSTRRSIVLLAVGALLGLLLAGYSLFTARGTSTLYVPPEDVALVNQQPVSRIDFIAQLQTLFGTDLEHATREQRQKVLNDMVREELFVQRGRELDLAASDPDVRAALVNGVELEIAADAITSQPTEAKLRAYYDAHREKYASEGVMTAHDYVFASDMAAAATAAVDSLKGAVHDVAVLAALKAHESSKLGDEQFYFAAKIHLGQQLFEVARSLPDGGVSNVIAMPDGLHVLYMEKNVEPKPQDFATTRQQVLADFRNDAIARLRTGDEEFLRKRANVLIADDLR